MTVTKEQFEFVVSNIPQNINGVKRQGVAGPIKIILASIKDYNALYTVYHNEELLKQFSTIILDIWKPRPKKQEDIDKKEHIRKNFSNIIAMILFTLENYQHNLNSKSHSVIDEKSVSETNKQLQIKNYLDKLNKKIKNSKENMQIKWMKTANPYITSFVNESWNAGQVFQLGAKISSSIETLWGNWIENAIYIFNPELFYINTGGMDFVKDEIAYDVKSGPQVMNKDQVEEAKAKHSAIQIAINNKSLNNIFTLKDFKVAIAYGNRNNAWPFMAREGDLMIYGPETWTTLTNDEWNAFRLFIY